MPNSNATPHIGKSNQVQIVTEFRVEILCTEQNIERAVQALSIVTLTKSPRSRFTTHWQSTLISIQNDFDINSLSLQLLH